MANVVAPTPSKVEFIVGGKYRLVRKIGSGSFGDIYLGINISNGEVSPILLKKNLQFWHSIWHIQPTAAITVLLFHFLVNTPYFSTFNFKHNKYWIKFSFFSVTDNHKIGWIEK